MESKRATELLTGRAGPFSILRLWNSQTAATHSAILSCKLNKKLFAELVFSLSIGPDPECGNVIAVNTLGAFNPVYRKTNPSFAASTFHSAERTSDSHHVTATTSERPGMLLGKIRSGKTRAFISILALAFDNSCYIATVFNKRLLINFFMLTKNTKFKKLLKDPDCSRQLGIAGRRK